MLHSQVDDPAFPLGSCCPAQLAVLLREVLLVPLRDLLVEMAAVVGEEHRPGVVLVVVVVVVVLVVVVVVVLVVVVVVAM